MQALLGALPRTQSSSESSLSGSSPPGGAGASGVSSSEGSKPVSARSFSLSRRPFLLPPQPFAYSSVIPARFSRALTRGSLSELPGGRPMQCVTPLTSTTHCHSPTLWCATGGSLRGDPPLRQNPCGGAESSTGSREIPVRSGGRAGNGAFQAPSMHPDSHLVVPYMLPSFANALCQRWHQRPGRGRLSVGSQSTTGEPAGRNTPKIEEGTEAAPLPRWSSATLVSLLVPPATVSRAPATSYAGCEWGVHGHRRRRDEGGR